MLLNRTHISHGARWGRMRGREKERVSQSWLFHIYYTYILYIYRMKNIYLYMKIMKMLVAVRSDQALASCFRVSQVIAWGSSSTLWLCTYANLLTLFPAPSAHIGHERSSPFNSKYRKKRGYGHAVSGNPGQRSGTTWPSAASVGQNSTQWHSCVEYCESPEPRKKKNQSPCNVLQREQKAVHSLMPRGIQIEKGKNLLEHHLWLLFAVPAENARCLLALASLNPTTKLTTQLFPLVCIFCLQKLLAVWTKNSFTYLHHS